MLDIVQSVDRALSILELVSEYTEGLGITEISEKVNLHKSTVHRLLGTLIYKGFIVQDSMTNKYKISLKLYELGAKLVEDLDILQVSKPYTEKLMKELNEVVHLVIRDNNHIVYIDKVEADNTIRMASNIGRRSPLYCTSVGKAILAFMDGDQVEKIWENSNIQKLTKNTITDYKMFEKELQTIREKGYAIDDEENEIGVRCIGAPVFNHNKEVEGAISISGPAIRVTKDKVEKIAEMVKKYADLISKELGYKE
ncbi:IclR family transcriptional regulator [Wansuia hejianensis]|uniref:Glycerol operon regulatory protein n=1 Tax=Wansuia hejianensis TaxID=2763667 RepID=A0A926F196_9FIRM|nr:IclR family transcriptional regulator [Wansuia hejianensis]MBC8590167.1 IclR family transcriptional regulator [Wansuia hejianensis]